MPRRAAAVELLKLVGRREFGRACHQAAIEELTRLLRARYGAIAVLDAGGRLAEFVYTGICEAEAEAIGRLPEGRGLLGEVLLSRWPLRLADLTRDPRSTGFPPHHPPMRSLLAVPIAGRGSVIGRVYLTEREDGLPFDEDDEQVALAFANALYRVLEPLGVQERPAGPGPSTSARDDIALALHDLNNLLTSVLGSLDSLAEELPADKRARARHFVGAVADATERMHGTLRNDRCQATKTFLGDAVRGAEALVLGILGREIECIRAIAVPGPRVGAGRGSIDRILVNLVRNAKDAMTGGGRLSLDVECRELGESSAADLGLAPGNYGVLRVADDGGGIPPDVLPRVFEPRVTTKGPGEGSGWGLASVREIARRHGGAVTLHSAPGRGTIVEVLLPRTDPPGRDTVPVVSSPAPPG